MFACTKFRDYVYGKPVVVETDHQPLVTILKKPIHTAPAHLQRMLLQLQSYDITLVYKKGKLMYLADTLSRAPDPHNPQNSKHNTSFDVMSVSYISTARLEELREHMEKDEVLQALNAIIHRGWPDRQTQLQPTIRAFFPCRDELTEEDGIIMKSHKAVIPRSLHKATKRRARGVVFWPSMSTDITEQLALCATCNNTRAHQQKEPLLPHQVPDLPWSTVATDIFDWHGKHYQVLVDSYSGWFEIDFLPDITSSTVITKLMRHFSVHGTPHILFSDNARQYSSQHFKNFSKQWDFIHATSSPEFPQSNGLAERAVLGAKGLLEKSYRDGAFLNLLNLRNIPRDATLGSPAERLMSRQTRAAIPVCHKLLEPAPKDTRQVSTRLLDKRLISKRHYDKSSSPLLPLTEAQVVRMQTAKGYDRLGTVKEVCAEPRSYVIQSNGGLYRRNRRHILPVVEPLPPQLHTADPVAHLADSSVTVSLPPTPPQTPEPYDMQSQHTSPARHPHPAPMAHSPTGDCNFYRTRSGRVCRPNPRYTQ